MKVLFIQPSPIFGGATTATLSICRVLRARGVTVIYSDEYDSYNEREGIEVDHYPYHRNRFKSHSAIRNNILSHNPDVVFWAYNIVPYFFNDIRLLKKQGIAQVTILHSLSLKRDIKGTVIEKLVANTLPVLNAIVFVSEYTLTSWNKYLAIRKSRGIKKVIYNAVSFHEETKQIGKPYRIGYVGRFSEEKQPALFCSLSSSDISKPGLEFHAYGDGPLLDECRGAYPNVTFHGNINNIDAIYNDVDVLLLTSKFENCPMVILEAKSRGIPCVAPRVGGIPEIVSDGVDGILYDTYNHAELFEAISRVIDNYGIMRESCLHNRIQFSYEIIGSEWQSLLSIL